MLTTSARDDALFISRTERRKIDKLPEGTFSEFKRFVRDLLTGKRRVRPGEPKLWPESKPTRKSANESDRRR